MKSKGKIKKFKSTAKNVLVQEQKPIFYSLNKTDNFLNNQKYIFGKSEERKVLATFLSQRTIQNIVAYLGLIDILFYFILGGIFICAMDGNTVSGFTIFIVSIMLPTILWGFYAYYVFQGKIPISKNGITNVKEYLIVNNTMKNKIFWSIFIICVWPLLILLTYFYHFPKYQTYKLQPKGKMMQNFGFLEKNVWGNGFYEIIKK